MRKHSASELYDIAMNASATTASEAVEHELRQIKVALRLMVETQRTQTAMLRKLIEAAAPSDEPHPLEEAMAAIAVTLRDQTVVLERIETGLGGLGAEIEDGVMRGLACALGVDTAPPEDSGADVVQTPEAGDVNPATQDPGRRGNRDMGSPQGGC